MVRGTKRTHAYSAATGEFCGMNTRQRARLAGAGSSSGLNSGRLAEMVDETVTLGRGRDEAATEAEMQTASGAGPGDSDRDTEDRRTKASRPARTRSHPHARSRAERDWCPITDKDTRPFPLMQLPPEIRNEIYRACLTRPFNILLSREVQPPPPVEVEESRLEEDSSPAESAYAQSDPPPSLPQARAHRSAAAATPQGIANRHTWATRNRRAIRFLPVDRNAAASTTAGASSNSTSFNTTPTHQPQSAP
ncbi:hypothetical protein LTR53_017617, partial [Teratosphaeriaceae sp. CCFEE 6253]